MRYKNRGRHFLTFAVLTLVLGSSAYVYFFLASSRSDFESKAVTCSVDAKLVSSCRPWLGSSTNDYGITSLKSRILDLESRTGKQLDIVHAFNPVGHNNLTDDEKFFATRANTILLLNWKPSSNWVSAGGGNATVNANIDTMADSVKSLGSKKIILAVWHEPNNDVSAGAKGCSANFSYKGSAGTPDQYRTMWKNVRSRFDAKGVTNVVWAMIYQSGETWDCMQKEMYPGNSLVDWVMWDHYYSNDESWQSGTSRFYTWLSANSDSNHNFLSKPWGIAEWGSWADTQAKAKQLYVDAGNALRAGKFPNIKAYVLWDAKGTNDSRIAYTLAGAADPSEQAAYATNFAQNPVFKIVTTDDNTGGGTDTGGGTTGSGTTGSGTTGSGTTGSGTTGSGTTTTKKTVVSGQSGSITAGQLLTLNEDTVNNSSLIAKITKVEFYLDDVLYQTVEQEPFALDTSEMTPGKYTIKQITYFEDGTTSTETRVIDVAGAQADSEAAAGNNKASLSQMILLVTIIVAIGGLLLFVLAWLLYWRPRGYTLGESVSAVIYPIKQVLSFKRGPKLPDYTDNDVIQIQPTTVISPPSSSGPAIGFSQPPNEASHKFPWV